MSAMPFGRRLRQLALGVALTCTQSMALAGGTPTPAAADHVGRPLPDYVTGDQCLFCHRGTESVTWQRNAHAWTIRAIDEPPAVTNPPKDATHVIGSAQRHRFLKLVGYGRFALLSIGGGVWQDAVFEKDCVGCHATGVDPKTLAFSSYALDCYACHGDVSLEHTNDPSLMWFSPQHAATPRQLLSICDQCHLRGGHSKTTGLPYSDNFVAGDDLFADYQVDLSRSDDATLDEHDRHVYVKTRAVLEGHSERTCVSCHKIHAMPVQVSAQAQKLHSEVCHY